MKSFLQQVLTCLIAGLLLSLTVFIPSGESDGKQHIYLTTSGRTDDIEKAIKALGRNDILIHHGGTGPFQMNLFEGWIFVLIMGTLVSAIAWAVLLFIYSVVCRCFKTSPQNMTLKQ